MSDLINLDERRIIKNLLQGDFKLTRHARMRMIERNITAEDLRTCGKTVSSIQKLDGKYILIGLDRHQEKITVICTWNGNTLIINLY